MKWYKQLTNAIEDPFVVEIKSRFGMAGLGRWFMLKNLVAAQMESRRDAPGRGVFDARILASTLEMKKGKLISFLNHLQIILKTNSKQNENETGINFEQNGNLITVEIPNLERLRDDTSRKKAGDSGMPPESLRRQEAEAEAEEYIPPRKPPAGGRSPGGADGGGKACGKPGKAKADIADLDGPEVRIAVKVCDEIIEINRRKGGRHTNNFAVYGGKPTGSGKYILTRIRELRREGLPLPEPLANPTDEDIEVFLFRVVNVLADDFFVKGGNLNPKTIFCWKTNWEKNRNLAMHGWIPPSRRTESKKPEKETGRAVRI